MAEYASQAIWSFPWCHVSHSVKPNPLSASFQVRKMHFLGSSVKNILISAQDNCWDVRHHFLVGSQVVFCSRCAYLPYLRRRVQNATPPFFQHRFVCGKAKKVSSYHLRKSSALTQGMQKARRYRCQKQSLHPSTWGIHKAAQ